MILLVSVLISGGPVSAQTKTLTDSLGRQVTVPENPQRILLGFYFEDFLAVGGHDAFDRVVAISQDAWKAWRNLQWRAYVAALPRIADLADIGEVYSGTFSLESAIAAAPDVAVLAAWQFEAMGDMAIRLEESGIPIVVIDFNAQTVATHVRSTLVLGQLLGRTARAQQLADHYVDAISAITARVAEITVRPKVYVELGRNGAAEIDNSYGNTMWGKLVDMAGGQNIAQDQVAKWAPLSPEFVLTQNPDMIVLAGAGWHKRAESVLMGPGIAAATTHARLRRYLKRPGWSGLAAVKSGQIHAVYHGGVRTLYDYVFLQYLAKSLHPEVFKDLDPKAALTQFFDAYMPIGVSGTYMTRLP
jgi:ABC-type Fe3+-hydroxamate transport system substrate-binding protein